MLATAGPDQQEPGFDPDERRPIRRLVKRTGVPAPERWKWVDDPQMTETYTERHTRLLADTRMIDMHGIAVIISRRYPTIKDIRHSSDSQREIAANARLELNHNLAEHYEKLSDEMLAYPVNSAEWEAGELELEHLDQRIIEAATHYTLVHTGRSAARVDQALFRLRRARKKLLTLMPRQRDEQGQTPLWSVGDAASWGRRSKKVDRWWDPVENRGRPKGSTTNLPLT